MTFDYDYSRDMFFHRAVSKTSLDDKWTTPKTFFAEISKEFTFDLDAAAVASSALCDNWYGPDHPEPIRRDAFLSADLNALKALALSIFLG